MSMAPVCSCDVSAVLYACVRCQAFGNSLSADMLVGQRELLAGDGPRTRPKEYRQLGLGLTYNQARRPIEIPESRSIGTQNRKNR
jgi:hypothetical protein